MPKGTGEEWERFSGEKEERGGREGMGGGADSPTECGMIVRRMTERTVECYVRKKS